MRNVFLIARREYMERIRAKSFMVMTVLIPLIMGGIIFSTVYFGDKGDGGEANITIVSPDTPLALHLKDAFAAVDPALMVGAISPPGADTQSVLADEVAQKESEGYLWVDAAAPQQAIFYGKPTARHIAEAAAALNSVAAQGHLRTPVVVHVQGIQAQRPAKATKTGSSKGVAYFLFFLMYFAVMLYGMNVARSITEEKTSRVFEVMLATITPEEMMAGKVLGVGGVGLTQVFIWIAVAAALVATPLVFMVTGLNVSVALSFGQMLFFLLMFILGFMLYSSIAAILGAIVNSEQELQQLTMVLALPLAVCMILLYPTSSNPNGIVATVGSLIPLCTPLLMFTRVAVGHPPAWQIALSVFDLLLAIYAMMWIASRIYRVGILMYGKRPSLSEILRWMRYS
jgi:ABC-2 type transport system permease protein